MARYGHEAEYMLRCHSRRSHLTSSQKQAIRQAADRHTESARPGHRLSKLAEGLSFAQRSSVQHSTSKYLVIATKSRVHASPRYMGNARRSISRAHVLAAAAQDVAPSAHAPANACTACTLSCTNLDAACACVHRERPCTLQALFAGAGRLLRSLRP